MTRDFHQKQILEDSWFKPLEISSPQNPRPIEHPNAAFTSIHASPKKTKLQHTHRIWSKERYLYTWRIHDFHHKWNSWKILSSGVQIPPGVRWMPVPDWWWRLTIICELVDSQNLLMLETGILQDKDLNTIQALTKWDITFNALHTSVKITECLNNLHSEMMGWWDHNL